MYLLRICRSCLDDFEKSNLEMREVMTCMRIVHCLWETNVENRAMTTIDSNQELLDVLCQNDTIFMSLCPS
jgi:hypothetical protein